MSEYGPDGQPIKKTTDPVVKILIGCALIAVGFLALVIVVGLGIGWRLTRDESPGRAPETFLLGDETAYWVLDLKADDPGVKEALQRIHEQSEAAREEALKNSPLAFLGSVRKPNQLAEMLPIKLELAKAPDTWAARVSFSRGTWRMRMGLKIMRWVFGRGAGKGATQAVDGVAVTTIPDPKGNGEFAFAMVGSRLLIAGSSGRLTRALDTSHGVSGVKDPAIDGLHESVRQAGEDGWAFAPGPSVASFDVNEQDQLRFVIAAPASMDARELPAPERALERVHAFLPYFREGVIVLDESAPTVQPDGSWRITGKIDHVSEQLVAMFLRFSAKRADRPSEPETPSATPTPPSPPTSSDPRSDTPGAPKRGESPTPAH
jgi:hypothetical protein